jgi:excisionase family DNA binding protein
MYATQAPLLTVPELAAALRVHPASIYRRIQAREICAIRLGPPPSGRLRVPESELDRLISSPSDVSDDGSPAGGSFAGTTPAARRGTSNVGEAVEPVVQRGASKC